MELLSVPFHLDERLDTFDLGVPAEEPITAGLPAGDPWTRMAALLRAGRGVGRRGPRRRRLRRLHDRPRGAGPVAEERVVPDGDLYVHVDVDVVAPAELPDLRYPAAGGVSVGDLPAALRALSATARVAAIGPPQGEPRAQRSARGWLVA